MDLLAAYIDAELAGENKPSDETIREIVESHGGTISESDPNVILTPDGEIRLDGVLNDASSGTDNPEEINKTIIELNKQINDLKGQLSQANADKENLQSQVTELNASITELNTQVASWKKKAEDGEITISEKDTQISNLNSQITSKNQEIEEKQNKIQELEGNVTTLTNEKQSLETQVVTLNARVAELEGKQATGDATAGDVLAGKTFSTADGVNLTGTMTNRGTLNFNPSSSTSQTVQAGYYSGGTVSTENAYSEGYEEGYNTATTVLSVEEAKNLVKDSTSLKANIGRQVNYHPEGGGTWRIFYYDKEGYFGTKGKLYLKRDCDENLKKSLTLQSSPSSDTLQRMKNLNPLWTASTNSNSIDKENEQAVAWLCDKSQWTAYCISGTADFAVGGPSVEMFIRAYNVWKTGTDTPDITTGNIPLMCKIGNDNGYNIGAQGSYTYGDSDECWSGHNSIKLGPNNIFITSNKNWWLASPTGRNSDHVFYANGSDPHVGGAPYINSRPVCPVVSIAP